jgi:hypothetical protein
MAFCVQPDECFGLITAAARRPPDYSASVQVFYWEEMVKSMSSRFSSVSRLITSASARFLRPA